LSKIIYIVKQSDCFFFYKIIFSLKFQYLQKKNSIRFPDKIQQFILKRKLKKNLFEISIVYELIIYYAARFINGSFLGTSGALRSECLINECLEKFINESHTILFLRPNKQNK
jgi:hypothetical protein